MELSSSVIADLSKVYGDAFYLLHTAQFEQTVVELKKAFTDIYPKFNIAYSYKTNYTPKLCKIIDRLGGYAEVVSDMEMEIALRIGVLPEKIIWNGPYKNAEKVQEILLTGGIVNIDSAYEIEMISGIAEQNPSETMRVGIRCNFDINDGVISRFGFDTESRDFQWVLEFVKATPNIHLIGMQCHFATRALDTWHPRAEGMLKLLDELGITPEYIDLGGGMYGKMADSLKEQFSYYIPTYTEYAETVAPLFAEHYGELPYEKQPLFLLEPGSALVGDCMSFVSKVVNIKDVRGKAIATLLGSIYNINPTLNTKNPPITVFHMGGEKKEYSDLDFGGFTCIESDYLYRHYSGFLAQNDMVMFGNVGSYSVVLKPPFILPNFPVLDIDGDEVEVIKRAEIFDDLFHTYEF
jgi:diaminopimelate decarboxylase